MALVGPDGAGKSTITERLEWATLPRPVKRIYMGVNLEASSLMLPTTRLLLAAKRARGGRPDLVAGAVGEQAANATNSAPGWKRAARDGARLVVWTGEEWLRQLVASGYGAAGYIVVFDRHFYLDYYHSVVRHHGQRELFGTVHGWILEHLYPKPDLVICLDAPAEVLFRRKPEASIEWLDGRRREYLELKRVVPRFVVVAADRPLDLVTADVIDCIQANWKERNA